MNKTASKKNQLKNYYYYYYYYYYERINNHYYYNNRIHNHYYYNINNNHYYYYSYYNYYYYVNTERNKNKWKTKNISETLTKDKKKQLKKIIIAITGKKKNNYQIIGREKKNKRVRMKNN